MVGIIGIPVTIIIGGITAMLVSPVGSLAWWGGLLLVLFGTCCLLFALTWRYLFSIKRWKFTTSESAPNLWLPYFDNGRNWRSQNQQIADMSYTVDFGRELNLIGIQFDHGISFEVPNMWRMWFFSKTNDYVFIPGKRHPYISTGDRETRQNTTAIIVELHSPIKVQKVKVEVRQPEIRDGVVEYWRVETILAKVQICNLKRCLTVQRVIGRCFLDEL